MKNFVFSVVCLSLWATTAACSSDDSSVDEVVADQTETPVSMTFKATSASIDTRSQLTGGTQVSWTSGDCIALISMKTDTESNAVASFTTTGSGTSADFTGSVLASKAGRYYAVYPYDRVQGVQAASTGSGMTATVTLPASQTALSGSFAEGLNLAYATATTDGGTLAFSNACNVIKLQLTGDIVSSATRIRLQSASSTPLSGTFSLGLTDGTLTSQSTQNYAEISGTFSAGQSYYLVVAPASLTSGFTLTVYSGDNEISAVTGSNAATLTAGHILELGTLDLKTNTFTEATATNSEFDVDTYNW